MSARGARGDAAGRTRAARAALPKPVDLALRAVEALLGLWLLVAPLVLVGPNPLVAVKDVVVGGLLLSLAVAAAAATQVRRHEGAVCVVLGAVLIAASVLVEFGPGPEAVARQWNEVVVGVLLVCLGAARTR